MNQVENYRLKLGSSEYLPIVVGGMGVDVSTSEMVLEVVRLGGVAHLSDAMVPAVCDKNFGTHLVETKVDKYNRLFRESPESPPIPLYDLEELRAAQTRYVSNTVDKKKGPGAIFLNCMEKVLMGAPMETMGVRLNAALDAGIDGITFSAGLHNYSVRLIEKHPRFRDVKLGIVVSSWRALRIFLRTTSRFDRIPDYVVVEGPLAGGHLGFGPDWETQKLDEIYDEVLTNIRKENLDIAVIPAGGIFNAEDTLRFLEKGAAGVQVATRFAITEESGFPESTKQIYCNAENDDILVASVSPTGYPIRLLKSSPCLGSNLPPQCIPLGYAMDAQGGCTYAEAYKATENAPTGGKLPVWDKTCLCHHIGRYRVYTCGTNVVRLKDTLKKRPDGTWQLPTTEQVFKEYLGK